MNPRIIATLLLAGACLLAGCGHGGEGAPSAAAGPAEAKQIAWFKGSVETAIATASKDKKLLLIYWGAKWCPYCRALRKTVFTRPDFIAKTMLFVPIYLDGDLPGAQAWGETFKVSGYPTLLILKPDRTELARMSGGMDLSQYAALLDEALQDQRPILDALHNVDGPEDCHRLAYYGWDPAVLPGMDAARLSTLLTDAVARCQGSERVRLQMVALNLALRDDAEHARPADHARLVSHTQLIEPVENLYALLDHPEQIRAAIDLIEALDDSLFTLVIHQGVAFSDSFRTRWVARMQEAADDRRFGDADRLLALASALDATKALSPEHAIPASMEQSARDRIQQALDADRDRFKRNDLVNAASIIYDELGDPDAARALYLKELANTRTPYYYMSHLAALAERQGEPQEALDWMAKAYAGAAGEGPATRLRWGSSYIRALLRLAPNDSARIRTTALQIAAEVSEGEGVHGRSRVALEQINAALDHWANTPQRRAVAAEVAAHLPKQGPAQST